MARAKRSNRPPEGSSDPASAGVLYVVATPIGNLEDLSPRARRVLHSVSMIAAEDTRRLRGLGGEGGFRARLVSIPPPREAERAGAVIAHLASGRSAAIVTDAGTPAVSDPGSRLVSEARAAGFRVVPIPGANAVATALAGAGLGGGGFLFLGFLPPQGMQRRRAIEEIATSPRTVVMFEAPHRLERTLMDLRHACGDERRGVIARELTKLHEEFVCGPLRDLVAALPERVRGEITLLVEGVQPGTGARSYAAPPRAESLASVVDELLRGGMSAARAAREASRRLGCDRRDAYRAALAARTQTPPKEPDRQ